MRTELFDFVIPGEPKGKGRPRFTRSGHPYTPGKTIEYENLVRMAFAEKYPNAEPLTGEVFVTIMTYFAIPKSVSKKKRELMVNNVVNPTKKPDLDNIAKSILDSLNGLAFVDDAQVVWMAICKSYAVNPRAEVMIYDASV